MSEMEMNKVLEACTGDMRSVAEGEKMTLDMQVRAYDLLSYLLEMQEDGIPYGLDNAVVSSFCAGRLRMRPVSRQRQQQAFMSLQRRYSRHGRRPEYLPAGGLSASFGRELVSAWSRTA